MFQRAPRLTNDLQTPKTSGAPLPVNMQAVIKAVENDPAVNRRVNFFAIREEYKRRGMDLENEYAKLPVTTSQDVITENFINNKEHSHASVLMETLPLFANKPGRLGDYIEAEVTKTAKQDDQGNTFIDLIVTINNTWLTEGAPKELQASPAKMTFLVDMTAAHGEAFEKKMKAFRSFFLRSAKRANALSYMDKHGVLGITRAKTIVAKDINYVERVGNTLGECITQQSADAFVITAPHKFDEQYRKYFLDFMVALGDNARQNILFLQGLHDITQEHTALINEYERMVAFVEAYKKTPVSRYR